jgi:peptidoglycan/xylan/chitin deacetylase (PgdA/CDA1 family)
VHKTPFICAVVLMLVFASCATAAEKTYLDWVNDSLAALEAGRTTDALQDIRQAFAANANDPLAHCALGLALLTGGRAADGRAEFAATARLDPTCAEAVYGMGLVALAKPDLAEAARLFCQAQQLRPDESIGGSIGYVKTVAGGVYDPPAENPYDESLQSLRALALMKTGNWADAQAIWQELQAKAYRTGFGERFGCSMTFVPDKPVALVGSAIGKSYRAVTPPRGKLPRVSGSVNLKADLTRAPDVHIVSFFVDGKFVGMSNTPPFNYIWDTTNTPNGVHALKIEGSNSAGDVVSTKSTTVLVGNKGPDLPSGRVDGEDADATWRQLWALMSLKPSAAAVNYNLALCAIKRGDRETAKAALERVLAANPDYMDAAHRLAILYGGGGVAKSLYRGDGARKVIALTFDDGPKHDAGTILDILKAKGVKATFFVVGAQVEMFPKLVKRMADEGHEIESHTYNHRDLEYLSEYEITQEIFKTSAAVRAATGRQIRYLRPPGGHVGKRLPNVMRRFGLTTVFWSSSMSPYEGKSRKGLLNHAVSSAASYCCTILSWLQRRRCRRSSTRCAARDMAL